MGIFRRDKPAVADVQGEVLAWIAHSTVPCVELAADGLARDRISPHLPEGSSWPQLGGRSALLVGQFDFGVMPALPDFPRSGLLQWFVADDDVLGSVFDDTEGSVGFEVRWYDDAGLSDDAESRAGQEPDRCLPGWLDLDDSTRRLDLWRRYATWLGENVDEVEFVYEEFVRGFSSPDRSLAQGSRVGGTPTFTQADPRGTASFAAADDPAGRLIVEVDSDVFMWGDAGIGQLFGDPAGLARGDLSSMRYHWDCS